MRHSSWFFLPNPSLFEVQLEHLSVQVVASRAFLLAVAVLAAIVLNASLRECLSQCDDT